MGVVLEGRIDVMMKDGTRSYLRGDRYYLPAGMEHRVKLHAGLAEPAHLDNPKCFDWEPFHNPVEVVL